MARPGRTNYTTQRRQAIPKNRALQKLLSIVSFTVRLIMPSRRRSSFFCLMCVHTSRSWERSIPVLPLHLRQGRHLAALYSFGPFKRRHRKEKLLRRAPKMSTDSTARATEFRGLHLHSHQSLQEAFSIGVSGL